MRIYSRYVTTQWLPLSNVIVGSFIWPLPLLDTVLFSFPRVYFLVICFNMSACHGHLLCRISFLYENEVVITVWDRTPDAKVFCVMTISQRNKTLVHFAKDLLWVHEELYMKTVDKNNETKFLCLDNNLAMNNVEFYKVTESWLFCW